jgi:hypothetical protein
MQLAPPEPQQLVAAAAAVPGRVPHIVRQLLLWRCLLVLHLGLACPLTTKEGLVAAPVGRGADGVDVMT